MPRLFWIVMALIGGGLALLLLSGDSGTTMGMDSDAFARLVYLSALLLVIGAGVLSRRFDSGAWLRNLAIWLLVLALLVGGYQYRYELQDSASRMTLGLVPGSPISIGSAGTGQAVRLDRGSGGHFEARAEVDGVPVTFMVDTGATATVLSAEDARRVGIDAGALSFTLPVSTANGVAMTARTTVGTIGIGPIERRRMPVLVAAPGALGQSLLGMNFLGTLSGVELRGAVMILRD